MFSLTGNRSLPSPLNNFQRLDRFRDEIRRAVGEILDGNEYAWSVQRDAAKALRDAAELIEVSRAIRQPL